MDQQERETFEGFAIVELMGHNVISGYCSEQVIGGAAMLRVDVPAVDEEPAYTKFFAPSAIYAITPTDEATALVAATRLRRRPIDEWIVPQPKQIAAKVRYGGSEDFPYANDEIDPDMEYDRRKDDLYEDEDEEDEDEEDEVPL